MDNSSLEVCLLGTLDFMVTLTIFFPLVYSQVVPGRVQLRITDSNQYINRGLFHRHCQPPPPFRNYTYQSYLTIHYNFVKELVDFPTFSKFFMHAWNRCGGLNKEHSMLVHSGAESIVTTSRRAEMEPKLQLNERATLR